MNNKVSENPSKNRKGDFSPLVVLTAFLVTLYMVANLMAVKIISIGSLSLFDAGTITFPFAYMAGDVLAEVWGYRTARKVIYLTFICNAMLVIFTSIGVVLPYPDYAQPVQDAYATIYTYVPRIVVASLISFLLGQLANARVLVWIKEKQKDGKLLWVRTIASSAVVYVFDTVLFVLIGCTGTTPASDLLSMIIVQYFAKILIEAAAGTPLAYAAIGFMRRKFL